MYGFQIYESQPLISAALKQKSVISTRTLLTMAQKMGVETEHFGDSIASLEIGA